jgi:hypothetical protein
MIALVCNVAVCKMHAAGGFRQARQAASAALRSLQGWSLQSVAPLTYNLHEVWSPSCTVSWMICGQGLMLQGAEFVFKGIDDCN